MGFHKPNGMDHPPASNPFQVRDELELTISPHSLTSLPITTSPLANVNDPFQSHTFMPQCNAFLMDDGMRLNGFHDLHIARNSVNAGGMHHATNDCNMHFMDNLMNQGVSYGGFHTPAVDMNFSQRGGNAAMELAMSNSLNTSKTVLCPKIGNMMPMLGHAQYRGMETNNVFQVSDSQSYTPRRMDGSFLTLGTGGKIEKRIGNNYNAGEMTSKLEGPSLSQHQIYPSHIRRNSSSPNPLLFPMNAIIANQHHSSGENCGNSDVAVNTNKSMFMPTDIAEGVSGGRSLPSLTFCDTSSSHLGSAKMSSIALESSNPTFFLPNLMPGPLQSYSNSLKSIPSEPSMYPCIPKAEGGLITQNHFVSGVGDTQTSEDAMLLSSMKPAVFQSSSGHFTSPSTAGNGQLLQRIAVNNLENNVMQPAMGNQFPKRLGLQLNGNAVSCAGQEHLLRKEAAHPPQTGKLRQDQSRRPHFPTVPASGPSHGSVVPIHINKKLSEPDFVPGGGIPTLKVNPFPQVSNIRAQPSSKRKAHEPAPFHQRMKISHRPPALPVPIPRPPILTSSSSQPLPHVQMPRRPPLTSSPTPLLPHLKWQGPDGPPKPTGQKCLLCKRDVAFSPDGPIQQPPVLPAVAVLPCGHVFHDHCLRIITPEDQSNDPPCIPCVIGET